MSDFPERIWAIETGGISPYRVSCSILEHQPDEGQEYVRADIHKAEIARLVEALRIISISPELAHLSPEQQHDRCVAIASAEIARMS